MKMTVSVKDITGTQEEHYQATSQVSMVHIISLIMLRKGISSGKIMTQNAIKLYGDPELA